MRRVSIRQQQGFTLVEMMVVMTVVIMVFALSSINLGRPQTITSLNTTVDSLVADIKSQQMLAMAGDQGGTTAQQPHGLYLQPNNYTLFAGASYSAGDSNNFTVNLNQGVTLATTFTGSAVNFNKGTGEVASYSAGNNTITLSVGGDTKVITIGRFGAVTVN